MHDSYAESMDPCVLCLMSRDDVRELLLGDPRIALRITEIMGGRLLEAERRLSDFVFKSLPERIVTLLLTLEDRQPRLFFRPSRAEVPYTHEQLAEMVGTHRETVTKVLNELREQGLIELSAARSCCSTAPRCVRVSHSNACIPGPVSGDDILREKIPATGRS